MDDNPSSKFADLRTEFLTEDGAVVAANDVSFALDTGETMGLVGESGAGKSVTARSLLQLVNSPGEITGGEVLFDGEDLLALSEREMRAVRGNKIALIPQDPMSSLNPVLTVGEQIVETIMHHQDRDRPAAREQAIEVDARRRDSGCSGAVRRLSARVLRWDVPAHPHRHRTLL